MPRIIKIIFAFILLSTELLACNGGCPSGGGYLGIVPQFNKNFAGIRYRLRSFSYTDIKTASTAKHTFETAEFWGRFYPAKRVQAFVFLPFQRNIERSEANSSLQGVGDLSFLLNYTLLNSGDSLNLDWKHTLMLGAGAKLPTGKYQQRNLTKQIYPITIQTGTGAYSAIGSMLYTLRHNKTGLSANLSYYYNGKNEMEYSFGNMFAANISAFYWLRAGSVSVLPSIGTYIENTEKDIDNNYYVNNSGGSIFYESMGMDIYIKNLAFGLNLQLPYYTSLPQRTQSKDLRFMLSAACLF